MVRRKGFTLVELLVVIAIIALLLSILLPGLNKAREMGKRVVCLNNIKQLSLAWVMYCDGNDGKMPDPWAYIPPGRKTWDNWVGNVSQGDTRAEKIREVKRGVLYPYCKDVGLYKCPTGKPGEMCTYSIAESMNGNWAGCGATERMVHEKRREIKRPSKSFVFVDEGKSPGSPWNVYYNQAMWWDSPTIRHSDGTNWGYADGHAEYHKWEDRDTIELAKRNPYGGKIKVSQPGNEDLEWACRGVWGKIGWVSRGGR